MPSPEHPQAEGRAEPEPHPYCQAARFAGERPAGRAYFQAQEAIFQAECDLSAYRLQLNRLWHVAVVGEPPPEDLDEQLRGILAAGEEVSLPSDVLRLLHERGMRARRRGPWSEGHYRPGKRL